MKPEDICNICNYTICEVGRQVNDLVEIRKVQPECQSAYNKKQFDPPCSMPEKAQKLKAKEIPESRDEARAQNKGIG